MLLYGPPGTGKTLLARAVAANMDANFLKVVSSAIVDKYIGESARLIREARTEFSGCLVWDGGRGWVGAWAGTGCRAQRCTRPPAPRRAVWPPATPGPLPTTQPSRCPAQMFAYARDHQPCIIFMDEIDAIGGRRFSEGTSADREIQRTLMELLSQLDGFDVAGKAREKRKGRGGRTVAVGTCAGRGQRGVEAWGVGVSEQPRASTHRLSSPAYHPFLPPCQCLFRSR